MIALYLYTIALLGTFLLCIAATLSGFVVSRSRWYLIEAALVGCFLIELLICFGDEWLIQNIASEIGTDYYEIRYPAIRIATGAGIVSCFWLLSDGVIGMRNHRSAGVAVALFCIASAIAVTLPLAPIIMYAFYALRQVFIGFALIRTAWWYHKEGESARARLARGRSFFACICILVAATQIEDTASVLLFPPPTSGSDVFEIIFTYRNVCENLLATVMGSAFAREAITLLALHFDRPLGYRDSVARGRSDALAARVDELMPAFAKAFSLTERERDVLALVMRGMSNRAIAEQLYVVEGTVKTHLHNVFHKTGTKTRDDLRKLFWRS